MEAATVDYTHKELTIEDVGVRQSISNSFVWRYNFAVQIWRTTSLESQAGQTKQKMRAHALFHVAFGVIFALYNCATFIYMFFDPLCMTTDGFAAGRLLIGCMLGDSGWVRLSLMWFMSVAYLTLLIFNLVIYYRNGARNGLEFINSNQTAESSDLQGYINKIYTITYSESNVKAAFVSFKQALAGFVQSRNINGSIDYMVFKRKFREYMNPDKSFVKWMILWSLVFIGGFIPYVQIAAGGLFSLWVVCLIFTCCCCPQVWFFLF